MSPTNVDGEDGTSMLITWDLLTLEEARGFFHYRITLSASTDRRRQSNVLTFDVPFNVTSYNVTGLDPQLTYLLSVGAAVYNESAPNGISDGPTSPPVSVGSPG